MTDIPFVSKIVVLTLEGSWEIGVIELAEGKLIVQSHDPEQQSELQALLSTLANRPLSYAYGIKEIAGGKTTYAVHTKLVGIKDAEYMSALADELTLRKVTISGQRVLATISQE